MSFLMFENLQIPANIMTSNRQLGTIISFLYVNAKKTTAQ